MNKPQVGDIWYRYEDQHTRWYRDGRIPFPKEYKVIKVTPQTVLIQPVGYPWREAKRQYIGSRASFAKPTKEQALQSFRIRRARAIEYLNIKLEQAKAMYKVAKYMQANKHVHPETMDFGNEELQEALRMAPVYREEW